MVEQQNFILITTQFKSEQRTHVNTGNKLPWFYFVVLMCRLHKLYVCLYLNCKLSASFGLITNGLSIRMI